MPEISHEQLLELLHYDPVTGYFTWLVNRRGRYAKKGRRAGTIRDGYIVICISVDGEPRLYLAHRLAWFYVHGVWPSGHLDHRELDRSDNRIGELREATRSQNMANSRSRSTSLTGIKGVSLNRQKGRYMARITKDGVHVFLGYHDSIEQAKQAYDAAAVRLFGEFART